MYPKGSSSIVCPYVVLPKKIVINLVVVIYSVWLKTEVVVLQCPGTVPGWNIWNHVVSQDKASKSYFRVDF